VLRWHHHLVMGVAIEGGEPMHKTPAQNEPTWAIAVSGFYRMV
jgi:hypothetical protein